MDKYEKNKIIFNVNGENKVNEILNYSMPLLIKEFKPYLNKKVIKKNETLLKEIKIKTDLILNQIKTKFNNKDLNVFVYLICSKYKIYLNVKLRFNNLDKNGFLYYEGYKYICDINFNFMGKGNNEIKKFYDFEPLKEIDLNKQLKIFEECLNLKNKLESRRRELKPYCQILQNLI